MSHDFYGLFESYWWLIFPIFGMGIGVLAMWQRHSRANRTIDIIKAYADQGRDPPPELLAALRDPDFRGKGKNSPSWARFSLFAALAAAFVMFALMTAHGVIENMAPFLFVALVMGGMSLGQLVPILTRREDGDRNPPR